MAYEIVVKLSKAFNATASDTRAVMQKYDAQFIPVGIPGSVYFNVTGVEDKDTEAFLAEFRSLKGVDAAYKKPGACPP